MLIRLGSLHVDIQRQQTSPFRSDCPSFRSGRFRSRGRCSGGRLQAEEPSRSSLIWEPGWKSARKKQRTDGDGELQGKKGDACRFA